MILNVTCIRNITVVIVCRAEIVVITVLIKAVGVQSFLTGAVLSVDTASRFDLMLD